MVSSATRVTALVTSLMRKVLGGVGRGWAEQVAGIIYIEWERRGFAE
jgi:hypothetical protein